MSNSVNRIYRLLPFNNVYKIMYDDWTLFYIVCFDKLSWCRAYIMLFVLEFLFPCEFCWHHYQHPLYFSWQVRFLWEKWRPGRRLATASRWSMTTQSSVTTAQTYLIHLFFLFSQLCIYFIYFILLDSILRFLISYACAISIISRSLTENDWGIYWGKLSFFGLKSLQLGEAVFIR